jgi:hypothetical protein
MPTKDDRLTTSLELVHDTSQEREWCEDEYFYGLTLDEQIISLNKTLAWLKAHTPPPPPSFSQRHPCLIQGCIGVAIVLVVMVCLAGIGYGGYHLLQVMATAPNPGSALDMEIIGLDGQFMDANDLLMTRLMHLFPFMMLPVFFVFVFRLFR